MTIHLTTSVAAPARRQPTETPWGPSQNEELIAEGIVFHSTSSHGGIHLDASRNACVHAAWRAENGWYEEDVDWGIAAITFPSLFPVNQVQRAHSSLMSYRPDQYEAATGTSIPPGASHVREDASFLAAHADRFIVRSAIFSQENPGMVECIATRGGAPVAPERRYLVPSDEYEKRGRHFVIDEARHQLYDGPSSFVGYSVR